jgi:hypothetical protein
MTQQLEFDFKNDIDNRTEYSDVDKYNMVPGNLYACKRAIVFEKNEYLLLCSVRLTDKQIIEDMPYVNTSSSPWLPRRLRGVNRLANNDTTTEEFLGHAKLLYLKPCLTASHKAHGLFLTQNINGRDRFVVVQLKDVIPYAEYWHAMNKT